MNYTTNKGVPKWAKAILPEVVKDAEAFLKTVYPSFDFSEANVLFSVSRHRSMYYHSDGSLTVQMGANLFLYNKMGATLTTPPKGLLVGNKIETTCALIHELTHYVQGCEKRKFSEVETTKNEIDYLKAFHPYWYSLLVPAH